MYAIQCVWSLLNQFTNGILDRWVTCYAIMTATLLSDPHHRIYPLLDP